MSESQFPSPPYEVRHLKLLSGEELLVELVQDGRVANPDDPEDTPAPIIIVRRCCSIEPIYLDEVNRSFMVRPWLFAQSNIDDMTVLNTSQLVTMTSPSPYIRKMFYAAVANSVRNRHEFLQENGETTEQDVIDARDSVAAMYDFTPEIPLLDSDQPPKASNVVTFNRSIH